MNFFLNSGISLPTAGGDFYPYYHPVYYVSGAQNSVLYHLFFGKLLHLNILGSGSEIHEIFNTEKLLQVLNIILSGVYLVFFWKLCQIIFKSKTTQLLAFVVQTNLLMFSFLAATINYDNLANICAVAATYFLFKNIRNHRAIDAVWFGIFLCIGFLTKISLLPLLLLLGAFFCWENRKFFGIQFREVVSWFKTKSKKLWIVVLLCIGIGANIFMWGGNVFRYNTPVPGCDMIFSHEICAKFNPIYKKGLAIQEFQSEKLKKEMTVLSPFKFIATWADYYTHKIFGIFSWLSFYPPTWILRVFQFLFLAGIVLGCLRFQRKNKLLKYAFFIALAYTLFLAFYANYKTYFQYEHIPWYSFMGWQGRYLFPVIALWIFWIAGGWMSVFPKKWKTSVAILIGLFFIASSFPVYFFTPKLERIIHLQKLEKQHTKKLEEKYGIEVERAEALGN
ncbi:hypothetical protein HOA64_04440 [bacterium]|nr:hypothetical protein [bacterium]MBT6832271.1 hypothetical protein [bacterium]MBT7772455.1 hypothetical protein [bacterium]